MVATGPMPGSTPISVPKKQPIKQYIRFWALNATVNPSIKLLKIDEKSMVFSAPQISLIKTTGRA